MVTLTINGKNVKAKENTPLLEIARKRSISIPTLCYHPDLTPQGSCRLCTVEISENGRTRMVTACNFPAREGIRVETHSPKVLQLRRILAELLLARCPQIPFVQTLAQELGVHKTSYKSENPENDCLLCGLCIRTCHEIVGAHAIGFSRRGTQKKIGTPFEIDSDRCVACGACEYICPTGAIKMEMDRIKKMRLTDTGTLRHCRYMRMGLIDFMVCSNGFECWRCEVDQRMEDQFGIHPAFALKPGREKAPIQVNGFTFDPQLLYSEDHVWCKRADPLIKLGFDEMASTLTLKADAIVLPPVGRPLKEKETLAEISSSRKTAKLLSPLSGVVSGVNHEVEENPSLVWRDPYRRGWLVIMQPDHPGELSKLLSGVRAKEWFSKEALNLAAHFVEWAPNLLPKEDLLGSPMARGILRDKWGHLVKMLLKQRLK